MQADDRLLDPKNTPNGLNPGSGVKRLNKVPLMIVAGVITVVLVMFLYIVFSRTAQQQVNSPASAAPKAAPDTKTVQDSVERLLADAPSGTIAAEPDPSEIKLLELTPKTAVPPVTPAPVTELETGLPPGMQAQLAQGANAGRLQPTNQAQGRAQPLSSGLSQEARERVRERVDKGLEQAIYGATSIQTPQGQGAGRNPAAARSGGSPAGFQGDTDLMRLDEQRKELQGRLANAMAGIEGGNPGAGGVGGNNALTAARPSVTGGTMQNWRLAGKRDAGERYAIKTGSIIPATMISGINSDLQGNVVAQVSQNVYDTATGLHVVLPQGSKLFGTYNSDLVVGQERVLLRWDRVIFPDSSTLDLGGMPGADQMGYSGFKDRVNNHYWKIFGSAFMLSLISAGAQSAMPDSNRSTTGDRSVEEELQLSMAQQFGETGREVVRKNLQIKPTLEIRPGYRFVVMINKDILFDAPYAPMALVD